MTLNCNGKLTDLSSPKVMGILNVTPDSFFDGGAYSSDMHCIAQVEKMLNEGANFIDVGAYSSKPNANTVTEAEELKRLLPVIKRLVKEFPDIILSVDTFRAEIAKQAIEEGAAIINDISAGNLDEKMMQTVAYYNAPYIIMHMRGTPQTMKQFTQYDDLLKDILFYFSERVQTARALGINDIILDPGFGFAKTRLQNFELLNKLDHFKITDLPLLAGLSRKSMIYKTLNTTPKDALNGTTALHMIALNKGARILRVHDVKEALETIILHQQLNTQLHL